MNLSLILFFLSLTGIIVMIWRELVLVKNGQAARMQHQHALATDLQNLKHLTIKNTKKFGYIAVFEILRFSIKSSNLIKVKSKLIINELVKKFTKNKEDSLEEVLEKKEVSKYLRVISEYRQKIRQMKHRIKEEEGIE